MALHRLSDFAITEPEYFKQMRNAFDGRYRTGRDVWSLEPELRIGTKLLAERLDPDSHVLDIGVGRAVDAVLLSEAGHQVTGIDVVMLDEWAELAKNNRVRCEVGYFPNWAPREPTVFDAILDNGCFHHQHPSSYDRYLTRVAELLEPGGVAAITVFSEASSSRPDPKYSVIDGARIARYFGEEEFAALLERNGLNVIQLLRIHRSAFDTDYLVALGEKAK